MDRASDSRKRSKAGLSRQFLSIRSRAEMMAGFFSLLRRSFSLEAIAGPGSGLATSVRASRSDSALALCSAAISEAVGSDCGAAKEREQALQRIVRPAKLRGTIPFFPHPGH